MCVFVCDMGVCADVGAQYTAIHATRDNARPPLDQIQEERGLPMADLIRRFDALQNVALCWSAARVDTAGEGLAYF